LVVQEDRKDVFARAAKIRPVGTPRSKLPAEGQSDAQTAKHDNIVANGQREMTKTHRVTLRELLPGMQDAFFEIIWRLFPWIQSIWGKESNGQLQLFVEAPAVPDKPTSDRLAYHVKEVCTAAEEVLDELAPTSWPTTIIISWWPLESR
jgi:hypothetical protein